MLQGFFKTGKGEYGEGDVFIGVRVPMTRAVCKAFKNLSLGEIEKLLASPIHEHRLVALILLSNRFAKADSDTQKAIFDLYMRGLRAGVGWMLREIGKRVDRKVLLDFLDKHAHEVPRTMLRYSIEHLPPEQRQHYMRLKTTASLQ